MIKMRKTLLWMSWVGCLVVFAGQACAIVAPRDFRINDQAVGQAPLCQITIFEGVTNRLVTGRRTKMETSDAQTKVNWQSDDGTLQAIILAANRDQAHTYRLTVSTGEKGKLHLLRVALVVPVDVPDAARFWDGYEERRWDAAAGALERANPDYTFPLACAYGVQQGVAVGITPDTIVSSLHSGIRRINDRNELFYETRLVVDADHPQTVTFVTYPFQPTFGHLDAVQNYYGLFPKAFRPTDGVDSRIYGVGGYLISCYRTGRLALNSIRRANTQWEWSYAPWLRSGDWYPEKNDWVEGTDVIHQYENYRDAKKGTWQEYHDARVRRFVQGNKTSAMFYYLLVKYLNEKFIKRYPSAPIVNKEGVQGAAFDGGTVPGDVVVYSSPYGSGLSDWLEEEIRKVVENYEISGFAFDMTNHSLDDYGLGQRKCGVGRTFNDNGQIYSPDTISAILIADAIHKLSRDGKTMGVIMNQAVSQISCFPVLHADAVMYESPPHRNTDNAMILRLMSGRKPMTFWGSIECGRQNTAIRWECMTDPKAAKSIMDGLTQHALLTCLRIGATPMNWAVPSVGRAWMPTLIELKQLGWNPTPAVISSSPDLWIGRFGEGTQTIITISNPKRQRVQADLSVLNRYLGVQAYAFVSEQGQALGQDITREKTTFAVDLAPKEIMVLRSVALDLPSRAIWWRWWQGSDAFPHVAATTKRLPERGKVELSIMTTGDHTLAVTGRTDNYPSKVLVAIEDSKGPMACAINQGCFQITLPTERRSRLNLIYEDATRLAATKEDIIGFFSEKDALGNPPPVAIVVPDQAGAADQVAAEMVESYYANLQAYRKYPNDLEPAFMETKWDTAIRIPIMPFSKVDQNIKKRIYIGTTDEFPSLTAILNEKAQQRLRDLNGGFIEVISPDNRPALWIGGKLAGEIETAVGVYLNLLDSKYIATNH